MPAYAENGNSSVRNTEFVRKPTALRCRLSALSFISRERGGRDDPPGRPQCCVPDSDEPAARPYQLGMIPCLTPARLHISSPLRGRGLRRSEEHTSELQSH